MLWVGWQIERHRLSQWRHYEPWLDPLKEMLGDAITRYRDKGGGGPVI